MDLIIWGVYLEIWRGYERWGHIWVYFLWNWLQNPVFSAFMAFILQGSVCESLLRRLCSGGVFIATGRRADRPACVESVSEVWMGGAAAEQRALVERAGTPVLSERLFCRAEQVSAEQLSPSLQVNTLWIISIYLQGHISIKVIAPFCSLILSALLSLPPVLRAPFRASALPSSCHQLACLLRRSFNQTAQWLSQTHWLSCVPALSPVAHSGICQHINALKCCLPPFCTSPLLIPPRPPSQEVLRQVLIRSDRSAQTQKMRELLFSTTTFSALKLQTFGKEVA